MRAKFSFLPYIFMLPSLIIIFFIYIGPLVYTIFLSTQDWNGIGFNFNFIGFDNFIKIFSSTRQLTPFLNTFILTISFVIFQNLIALIIAVLINDNFKGRNFFRTVFFIPPLIATTGVAFVWRLIFDPSFGPIKNLGKILNVEWLTNIRFLGDSRVVLYSIIIVSVWQWFGWNMILYIAGLQAIPYELYEAALIDGASSFAKLRYITIPLLVPTITINIIMTTIGGLKFFDLPYVMTAGGPGHASETLVMRITEVMFTESRVGFGAALSLVLIVIMVVISVVQNRLLTRREVGFE